MSRTHEHEHSHDEHEHDHSHPHGGVKGFLYDLFVPHTHDAADSVDDVAEHASEHVREALRNLDDFVVTPTTTDH